MNVIGKVTSTVKPEATTIDQYSVWVAKNIQQVEVEDGTAYTYDLTQYEKDEYIKLKIDSSIVTASISFVKLAETGTIDEVTAVENVEVFSPWVVGIKYKVNELRKHNEELYKCVQEHTSQADWEPNTVPALWVKVGDPAEEWPNWSQPVGAHDAYDLGAKVTHNDKHWISSISNNVWEPGVPGWDEAV